MEYNSNEIKLFLKMYREIHEISLAENGTQVYFTNNLENLRRLLTLAREFPKEFYSGDKTLEEDFKKSISLLEEVIRYHEEDLETNQEKSHREKYSKRPRPKDNMFNH